MIPSSIRWAVFRNQFPFAAGDLLGHVHAPDKAAAREKARMLYGPAVVVQSAASCQVDADIYQRTALEARALERRKVVRPKVSFNGRRTNAPKARGPHDPRGPRQKPLGGSADAP